MRHMRGFRENQLFRPTLVQGQKNEPVRAFVEKIVFRHDFTVEKTKPAGESLLRGLWRRKLEPESPNDVHGTKTQGVQLPEEIDCLTVGVQAPTDNWTGLVGQGIQGVTAPGRVLPVLLEVGTPMTEPGGKYLEGGIQLSFEFTDLA